MASESAQLDNYLSPQPTGDSNFDMENIFTPFSESFFFNDESTKQVLRDVQSSFPGQILLQEAQLLSTTVPPFCSGDDQIEGEVNSSLHWLACVVAAKQVQQEFLQHQQHQQLQQLQQYQLQLQQFQQLQLLLQIQQLQQYQQQYEEQQPMPYSKLKEEFAKLSYDTPSLSTFRMEKASKKSNAEKLKPTNAGVNKKASSIRGDYDKHQPVAGDKSNIAGPSQLFSFQLSQTEYVERVSQNLNNGTYVKNVSKENVRECTNCVHMVPKKGIKNTTSPMQNLYIGLKGEMTNDLFRKRFIFKTLNNTIRFDYHPQNDSKDQDPHVVHCCFYYTSQAVIAPGDYACIELYDKDNEQSVCKGYVRCETSASTACVDDCTLAVTKEHRREALQRKKAQKLNKSK